MSKLEIAISPSIFQLESRSKAQNIGNAPGYFAGTLNFWHYFGERVCCDLKMTAILKILKYESQLHFDTRYEKIVPNYAKNVCFMVMTSSMTSHGGLKFGPLYSCLVEARPEQVVRTMPRQYK